MSFPKIGAFDPRYPKSVGPEFSSSPRLPRQSDAEKICQIGSAGNSRGGYVEFELEKELFILRPIVQSARFKLKN